MKRKYWILFIWMSFSLSAFGWSAGHDDVQKAILERLPIHLTAGLTPEYYQKLINYYSHYPDSHAGLDKDMIGEEAVVRLEKEGIKRRLDLHSDKSRALTFLELIRSLREKDFVKANFWIACLAHTTADPAATNHEAITQLMDYIYGKEANKYKTAKGNFPDFLELHSVAKHPLGQQIFNRKIDQYRLPGITDLQDALLEIMLYDIKGGGILADTGFDLVRMSMRYADEKNELILPIIFANMSELGAWGIRRTLRDVDIALRLADSDVGLELLESTLQRYQQYMENEIADRKLYDDGMWRYISAFESKEKTSFTGILVEPAWYLNKGLLGFTERKLSYNIANHLRKSSRNFRLVDVREVLKKGFPEPDSMPVMVMAVRNRKSKFFQLKTENLDNYISEYLEKGGRIIWIGGTPPSEAALPDAPFNFIERSDQVKAISVEDVQNGIIRLEGSKEGLIFKEPLVPAVGWQHVHCSYWIENRSGVNSAGTKIATLATPDGISRIISAAWPVGGGKVAFLPTYMVLPFLLTRMTFLPTPVEELTLDEIGATILNKTLDLLSP